MWSNISPGIFGCLKPLLYKNNLMLLNNVSKKQSMDYKEKPLSGYIYTKMDSELKAWLYVLQLYIMRYITSV